jgi:hypothetical protein
LFLGGDAPYRTEWGDGTRLTARPSARLGAAGRADLLAELSAGGAGGYTVLDAVPVPRDFSADRDCQQRRYEYVLPCGWLLSPAAERPEESYATAEAALAAVVHEGARAAAAGEAAGQLPAAAAMEVGRRPPAYSHPRPTATDSGPPPPRVISEYHFAVQLNHFIPVFLS